MSETDQALDRLHEYLRESAVLQTCRGLLNWDQETYMPEGSAELRGRQLALLSGIAHRRSAADQLGDLLEDAEEKLNGADPESPAASNVREAKRDFVQARKIPAELVEEHAEVTTLARRAWAQARADNDYPHFQPWLRRIVKLSRRFADALGYEEHAYDALLDQYEPHAKTSEVRALFEVVSAKLADLLARIVDSGRKIDTSSLHGQFDPASQHAFAQEVTSAIGFDFARGRLDRAVHPFCTGLGPWDVRITTRFNEKWFPDGLFSALHEAGHGLYEQGLAGEQFGWPMGSACSLGIHESQSRLWENTVGRSRGFWTHFYPKAQANFSSLKNVPMDQFYAAINEVKPSMIRVDADEVTYNLHVMLRFELEQALLTGDIDAKDLPEAWNTRFEEIFRIRPQNDTEGCLQDIHWSAGLFGYFATYTLGNVYSAQLYEKAQQDLGDLDEQFAKGEFAPLRTWLNEKIHWQGRRFAPTRLIERVTGRPPAPEPLIASLEAKYGAIYGV